MDTHYSQMENTTRRDARDRVMADLKTLARDAEDLIRATATDASEAAKDARVRLTAALDRTKKSYQDFQQQSLESAKAGLQKTDDTIRSHPYETVGIALGIGILVGALLRRR